MFIVRYEEGREEILTGTQFIRSYIRFLYLNFMEIYLAIWTSVGEMPLAISKADYEMKFILADFDYIK